MYPYRTSRGGTVDLGNGDQMRSIVDSGVLYAAYVVKAERHARAVATTERTRQRCEAGQVSSRGELLPSAISRLGVWLVAVGVRMQGVRAAGANGASVPIAADGTVAEPA